MNRAPLVCLLFLCSLSANLSPAQLERKGVTNRYNLQDSTYQRSRSIWIYTPPGYDSHRPLPYPLIVAFDASDYLEAMPLPELLDSLSNAGLAPSFVAVLIDDSTGRVRIADLANVHRLVEFLGGQLLPWVRKGWHVTRDPSRVIVTGSSAGGLGAAYAAFERPDLFGNAWSQSGAFWRGAEASNDPPYEWLTAQVNTGPRKKVRFFLDVGAGEDHPTLGGSGPNFLEANRRFHKALLDSGYDVTYTEVPGGNHAPEWWWPRLGFGIKGLSAGWPQP